mmetsp:Transcript_39107/g.60227  ORF Transcript_39107/g.60227 Transcript_39107/m.60227 type:complete len:221 (-) Transcript_39107:1213-1875(-)
MLLVSRLSTGKSPSEASLKSSPVPSSLVGVSSSAVLAPLVWRLGRFRSGESGRLGSSVSKAATRFPASLSSGLPTSTATRASGDSTSPTAVTGSGSRITISSSGSITTTASSRTTISSSGSNTTTASSGTTMSSSGSNSTTPSSPATFSSITVAPSSESIDPCGSSSLLASSSGGIAVLVGTNVAGGAAVAGLVSVIVNELDCCSNCAGCQGVAFGSTIR